MSFQDYAILRRAAQNIVENEIALDKFLTYTLADIPMTEGLGVQEPGAMADPIARVSRVLQQVKMALKMAGFAPSWLKRVDQFNQEVQHYGHKQDRFAQDTGMRPVWRKFIQS